MRRGGPAIHHLRRDERYTEGKILEHGSRLMTLVMGAYFFFIAFILAHLEIQIEGPYGWAEKLPTWRWDSPRVRRWFGKPVTGYHLCLVTCPAAHRDSLHASPAPPGLCRSWCPRRGEGQAQVEAQNRRSVRPVSTTTRASVEACGPAPRCRRSTTRRRR